MSSFPKHQRAKSVICARKRRCSRRRTPMELCRSPNSNFGVSKIGIDYLTLYNYCHSFYARDRCLHSTCIAVNRPDGQAVVVPASDDCLSGQRAIPTRPNGIKCRWKRPRSLASQGSLGTFPAASQTNHLLSLLITLAYLFTLGLAYGLMGGKHTPKHTPLHAERLACHSPLFPSIPPPSQYQL